MATGIEHVLPVLRQLRGPGGHRGLTEIGRQVALSPAHAQRVITRLAGESPDRYQRRLRLERAAALLLSTDDRIIDIALTVGFDSHEAFTRAFRRHYAITPTQYRRRPGVRLSIEEASRVGHVGPCIGVLPAAIQPPPTSRNRLRRMDAPVTYSIERTELTATPVLFIRSRVDRNDVAEALGQSLPAVYGHVMASGLAMAGPPYVRYIDQSPAFFTLEAGIPLVETPPEPPAESGMEAGELPAGPAVTTVHVGPYDTLSDGHEALDRWMAEESLSPGSGPWEIYLTDPAEVPDPAQWQTQIVWPLA